MDSATNNSSYLTYSRPRNWTASHAVSATSYTSADVGGGVTASTYGLTRIVTRKNVGGSSTEAGRIYNDSQSFYSASGTQTYSSSATYKDRITDSTSKDSTGEFITESNENGFTTADDNNRYTEETTVSATYSSQNLIVINQTQLYTTTSATRYMQNYTTVSVQDVWFETTLNSRGKLTTMAGLTTVTKSIVAAPTTNESSAIASSLPITTQITAIGWDTKEQKSKSTTIKGFGVSSTTIQAQVSVNPYPHTFARFSVKTNQETVVIPWATHGNVTNFVLDNVEKQPEALFWPKSFAGSTIGKLLDVYSQQTNGFISKNAYQSFVDSSRLVTINTIEISNGQTKKNGSAWDTNLSNVTSGYTKTFNLGAAQSTSSNIYTYSDFSTFYTNNDWSSSTYEVTFGQTNQYTTLYYTWMATDSFSVTTSNSFVTYNTTTILFSANSYIKQLGTVTLTDYVGLQSTTHPYVEISTTTNTVASWDQAFVDFITNETTGGSTKTQLKSVTKYTVKLMVPEIQAVEDTFGMTSFRRVYPKGFGGWASSFNTNQIGVMAETFTINNAAMIFGSLKLDSTDISTAGINGPANKDEQAFIDTNNNPDLLLKFFPYQTDNARKYWTITKSGSTYRAQYGDASTGNATSAKVIVTWTTTSTINQAGQTVPRRLSQSQEYEMSLQNTYSSTGKYYAESIYTVQNIFAKSDRFEFPGGIATNFVGGAFGGYDYFQDTITVVFNAGYMTFATKSGDTSTIGTSGSFETSTSANKITLTFEPNQKIAWSWQPVFTGTLVDFGNYDEKILRIHPFPGFAAEEIE
jgi:hypothetical protein